MPRGFRAIHERGTGEGSNEGPAEETSVAAQGAGVVVVPTGHLWYIRTKPMMCPCQLGDMVLCDDSLMPPQAY